MKKDEVSGKKHSVKSVQNTEFFLVRKSPHSVRIRENTDQKKNVYLDTFHTVNSGESTNCTEKAGNKN